MTSLGRGEADLDDFPCGALMTGTGHVVVYANRYMERRWGFAQEGLAGTRLPGLMTRGSQIFFDSFIDPMLAREGGVEEIQVQVATADGQSEPVMVSAARGEDGLTRWVFMPAVSQQRLHDEFAAIRDRQEAQVDELRDLASVDELTGLFNRRELYRRVTTLLSQSARSGTSVALLVIDIDHFKVVNDTHGHAVGDTVLSAFAHALLSVSRQYDVVARFGGEEFVAVLPDTDIEAASRYAGRIHDTVAQIPGPAFTVSIGLAVRAGPSTFDELFRVADEALLRAKRDGRNRTVIADATGVSARQS